MIVGGSFFHSGSVLMGSFDNRPCGILHWGNEKQIREYTKRLLDSAGTERLILSADCSVQWDAPAEHLRWVAEAAGEYAGYK